MAPHRPSPTRRRAAALGTALLLVGGLAACGSDADTTGAGGSPAGGDAPLVVVTTTQLADFARTIGGDLVEVHSLLTPNSDAHDFDPTPRDLDALARAEAIVRNGLELDPWLDDAVAASGTEAEVVDASEGARLLEGGHAHDDDDDDHAAEDDHSHDGDEHAAEDDDHNHDGEHDPHLWFDPANAEVMAGHVADAIVAAVPEAEAQVREREAAYVAELEELDAWIEAQLEPLEDRKLVTDHEALTYYVDRYDLDFVGAVIPSFDSAAEVSAAELAELAERIEAEGVTAIFTEQSLPARGAETLARQTGVRVVSGEEGLYGDSLGPEGSPGETYLGMMRHNTTSIVDNLS
jgi:ABC-type Zn uptake system ZnuABC Zn-binding protein ZnuA